MGKPKLITDYVPTPIPTKPVMGRVPETLLREVQKIRARQDLTWDELLTACLSRYVDEGGKMKVNLK